jgi:hypothetical protein
MQLISCDTHGNRGLATASIWETGLVITAAHVVGWAFLNPSVLIAGVDLPAKVIKKGAYGGST